MNSQDFALKALDISLDIQALVDDATGDGDLLIHILMSHLCVWTQQQMSAGAPPPTGLLELMEDALKDGDEQLTDAVRVSFVEEFDAASQGMRLSLAAQSGRHLRVLFDALEAQERAIGVRRPPQPQKGKGRRR